jgi:cytochrome P450
MAFHQVFIYQLVSHSSRFILLSPVLFVLLRSIYRILCHPLSHVPGPWLPACTSTWLNYHAWNGDECTTVHKLHVKYGPVVRTGPNDVDIADGEALNSIYVEKGGFRKASFYANFDIDGHKSIFSQVEPSERAPRTKAVLPLFSTGSLRAGSDTIYECVDRMVVRMKEEAKSGEPVNILNLTRSFAVDAMTAYLFNNSYGGLEETGGAMSASAMVNAFVAFGRFFYLPNWLIQLLEWGREKLLPDDRVNSSIAKVDCFVASVVDRSRTDDKLKGNYPSRLVESGFSVSETRAQCKDLIFAGTDSTGMNLAMICFMLAKHPHVYGRLRREVLEKKGCKAEMHSLPYLRGVIREGLRLSFANPARLPRVVPPSGWTFKGTFLPAGTIVSCTPFEIHLNPEVFVDPYKFWPERWDRPTNEMNRDSIWFGLGTRQCIARNLATMELVSAVHRLVEGNILDGARCCQEEIKILEWFNSKVKDEKIELVWSYTRSNRGII